MKTKTQQAIEALRGGDYRTCLDLFSRFRLGFSREEKRLIEIASEVVKGNEKFYQSIGIDAKKVVEDSISLLRKKFPE